MTPIEEVCIRRIAEAKEISPQEVGLDSTLESLAVDSLDRVSLSFDLEEQYGVEIPESRLHTVQTVGDVATAVSEALEAKSRKVTSDEAGAA